MRSSATPCCFEVWGLRLGPYAAGVLIAAVTGGIGSGKSTVVALLAQRGAAVIDADAVAREVVEPGKPALARLVERFGPGIVTTDGRLDRPALAAIVFSDVEARRFLDAITHPAIGVEIQRRILAAPPDAIVVCDVPLLAEGRTKRPWHPDAVVVVEAGLEARLQRLVERGLTRADAEARIAVQATDEQRRAMADYVIDNSEGLDELTPQVDALWTALEARHAAVSEG